MKQEITFVNQLIKYHREILNGNIYLDKRLNENLADLIEGMTNINTLEKLEIFNKICLPN